MAELVEQQKLIGSPNQLEAILSNLQKRRRQLQDLSAMNRQWLYAKQPQGKIGADTFQWTETAIPVPRDGEALVRTRMLSLDPANRAWMMGKTYRDALEPGQVMSGFAIGEVVESKAAGLKRRHRRGRLGLAGLCRAAGAAADQAHDRGAARAADRPAQRHRPHRLFRPARGRPAQARRHGAGVGGGRRGRHHGRPDRQARGLPRGRHGGRPGQVRLAGARARLRCGGRLQGGRRAPRAGGGVPQRHRRLFRQYRRAGARRGAVADEPARPHRLLRQRLAIRRREARRPGRWRCPASSSPSACGWKASSSWISTTAAPRPRRGWRAGSPRAGSRPSVDIVDGLDKAPEALIGLFEGTRQERVCGQAYVRGRAKPPATHRRLHGWKPRPGSARRTPASVSRRRRAPLPCDPRCARPAPAARPRGEARSRSRCAARRRDCPSCCGSATPRTLGQRLGEARRPRPAACSSATIRFTRPMRSQRSASTRSAVNISSRARAEPTARVSSQAMP